MVRSEAVAVQLGALKRAGNDVGLAVTVRCEHDLDGTLHREFGHRGEERMDHVVHAVYVVVVQDDRGASHQFGAGALLLDWVGNRHLR